MIQVQVHRLHHGYDFPPWEIQEQINGLITRAVAETNMDPIGVAIWERSSYIFVAITLQPAWEVTEEKPPVRHDVNTDSDDFDK